MHEIAIFCYFDFVVIQAIEIDPYRDSKVEKSKWDNNYPNPILLSYKESLYFLVIPSSIFPKSTI